MHTKRLRITNSDHIKKLFLKYDTVGATWVAQFSVGLLNSVQVLISGSWVQASHWDWRKKHHIVKWWEKKWIYKSDTLRVMVKLGAFFFFLSNLYTQCGAQTSNANIKSRLFFQTEPARCCTGVATWGSSLALPAYSHILGFLPDLLPVICPWEPPVIQGTSTRSQQHLE